MPGGPPATFYGTAKSGDLVEAFIRDSVCGALARANAAGFWQMQIAADAPCRPRDGDPIEFRINGAPTDASETWQSGGAPRDVARGIVLRAVGSPRTMSPEAMNLAAPLSQPGTAPTGSVMQAGLLGEALEHIQAVRRIVDFMRDARDVEGASGASAALLDALLEGLLTQVDEVGDYIASLVPGEGIPDSHPSTVASAIRYLMAIVSRLRVQDLDRGQVADLFDRLRLLAELLGGWVP